MKIFYCCLLLLLGCTAAAQHKEVQRPAIAPHQLVVSINPLPLLNADQRLMLGIERRIRPRLSLVADAGVVVNSGYLDEMEEASGFELRPALRYYYSRQGTGFVQGQIHFRNVNYQVNDWLGMDCINGVPTYEKQQDFTFQKQNIGAAVVTGGTERLGRHFLLDVSVGFGLMYRTQQVKGKENCCYLPPSSFFGNTAQTNAWVPIVPIAVKLGYVIR